MLQALVCECSHRVCVYLRCWIDFGLANFVGTTLLEHENNSTQKRYQRHEDSCKETRIFRFIFLLRSSQVVFFAHLVGCGRLAQGLYRRVQVCILCPVVIHLKRIFSQCDKLLKALDVHAITS